MGGGCIRFFIVAIVGITLVTIAIVGITLVTMGLLRKRSAEKAVAFQALFVMGSSVIGASHHYWWIGQPDVWLPLGSIFSTLELQLRRERRPGNEVPRPLLHPLFLVIGRGTPRDSVEPRLSVLPSLTRLTFVVDRLSQFSVLDGHPENGILMATPLRKFVRFDEEVTERFLVTFDDEDGDATVSGVLEAV